MGEKLEALWVVSRDRDYYTFGKPYKLFRTRAAARKFMEDKNKKSRAFYKYSISRITWGPEQ